MSSVEQPLLGNVALVTGASRGIGKGVSAALAKAGATVYATGRTVNSSKTAPGTVSETAQEINEAVATAGGNGRCIAIQCDHTDDAAVAAVFDRVLSETGRLDILVNNAYGAALAIMKTLKQKFWEKDLSMWDKSNDVGLRSHYVASALAARYMVNARSGLIVNISSFGGWRYAGFAGDVAYGVGKAASDRLANDMAVELKPYGVAAVSLWPGMVNTELVSSMRPGGSFGDRAESPEFAGRAIVALAQDKNLMKKTGKVLLTTELATELAFTDISGSIPKSHPPNLREELSKPPTHWDLNAKL